MVSVDGTKNVELLIDQKHKVTEAATENSHFAEEVKELKGEKVFGTEHILYIVGDQKDIKQTKKEGKSLSMYLAEQAVSENNLQGTVVLQNKEIHLRYELRISLQK